MSMIGRTLGNFELTSQIGKGGMGEVYQAKDQKLGRDVAIKVLPEEFAQDTERMARFQREAKLLASLNHPNIAAIHGLEESDGTHFLVLELIEGDTLAERIKGGPVPVEEALKLGLQITEALEAAHEKGVIHRDLKPANIKVTPDGKVKVLDFGLAKAFAGDPENVNLSNSPTLSEAATQQGVILGTAAYMSPEQARGNPVDKRADIWAFGVVLFEMLTGRQIFSENTVSDTLASVLKTEPKWDNLPQNLHPRILFLLERCLKKESKNRYSSISDARVEIQEVLADPSGVILQPGAIARPRKKIQVGLPLLALSVVLSLIIAGVAVWKLKPNELQQVMRFDYELPEDQEFSNLRLGILAVSPDGKHFAYSTPKGLYLRSMDELAAKLIAGTEGPAMQPFFSPDGKSIGYYSGRDQQLKKISINGGAPIALCKVQLLYGAWWGVDDTIVYGQANGDIMQVPANGGTPQSIIKKTGNEALLFPQVLPDGKSALYARGPSVAQRMIVVQSLETGEVKELFPGVYARYISTGHIVYEMSDNNDIFAIPFDHKKLEVFGDVVSLVKGVRQGEYSDTGILAYIPGTNPMMPERTLVWVDREGKEEPLGADPDNYQFVRISPDGTRVGLTITDESDNEDIYIWDIAHRNMMKLTFDEGDDTLPLWTPDSKRIVFLSTRNNSPGIYTKNADGTGEAVRLSDQGTPVSWADNGNILVLIVDGDIGILPMEGDKAIELLLHKNYTETVPLISPNGKWMAYMSDESGQYDIYVCPFPDVNGGKWKVSTNLGLFPRWSWDGRELFYWTGDALMVVAVESEPTFKYGNPEVLLPRRPMISLVMGSTGISWDNHPDDKRFLVIKPGTIADDQTAAEAPRKIVIVTNWFEELKERVPVE
jgi:serine/threonine protein kinase/Tol biopolymer transport system component